MKKNPKPIGGCKIKSLYFNPTKTGARISHPSGSGEIYWDLSLPELQLLHLWIASAILAHETPKPFLEEFQNYLDKLSAKPKKKIKSPKSSHAKE